MSEPRRAPRLSPDRVAEAVAAAVQGARRRGLIPLPVRQGVPQAFRSPTLKCPSVPAESDGARLLAVNGGPGEAAAYLREPLPLTEELLSLAAPARPGEVFRCAGPCAEFGCDHFQGSRCQLAAGIVRQRAPVVDVLPPCPIRATCRWFHQERSAACLRCPGVVTERPMGLLERLREAVSKALPTRVRPR